MDCPICFLAIDTATTGITTMACNHSYHFNCLAKWFISQPDTLQSCPCCRREASSTERIPMTDEIGGEEMDEESEDDDDLSTVPEDDGNWPGRNDVFVPIPAETTVNYRLTATWTQAPNGTWRRQVLVEPPAPVEQQPQDGMKLLVQAVAAETIATAIGRAWRERIDN